MLLLRERIIQHKGLKTTSGTVHDSREMNLDCVLMTGIIRFFDYICLNRHFATNADGDTVLYPFGRRWRGYLLPAEKESDVRRAMRVQAVASWTVALFFVLIGAGAAAEGFGATSDCWFLVFLWLVLTGGVLIYSRFSLVRGLARVSDASKAIERE